MHILLFLAVYQMQIPKLHNAWGEAQCLFRCLWCCSTQHDCQHQCIMLVQVVVQGIPFAYAWQDLKDLFKPVGGVKADIVVGQDGRSKGWGTVLFDTPEDAERAIQVYSQYLLLQNWVCLFWSACCSALSCSSPAGSSACISVAVRIDAIAAVVDRVLLVPNWCGCLCVCHTKHQL